MSRLLSSNFARLFKSMLFKLCLLFMAGLGIIMDIMRYIDIKENADFYSGLGNEYKSADCFVFVGALYLVFVMAVFVGIFVGTEYSDGTVRNKLMIGHKRSEIYLANFIVCAVADLLMLLIYIAVTLGVGMILFEKTYMQAGQIIIFSLMQCLSCIALTAVFVLFSMLINNKTGGSVTVLIVTIVMLVTAMTVSNRLIQPEYYEDYSLVSTDFETGEAKLETVKEKNPRYLTGTKRQIYEFLNNALPINQLYKVNTMSGTLDSNGEKDLYTMAACSAALIIISSGAGIAVFRKKDLK